MTETDRAEDAEGPGIFTNLPDILWQRRQLILVPAMLAGLAGSVAVAVMKPVYNSRATILIESQQLPEQVASTPVDDMIDQRIARVRQRVLSRPDLVKIIRANNLYPEDQKSRPLSQIVEEMRAATTIQALGADVSAGSSGGKSTIAFQIGFDYRDPVKAQIVAQQYVNNFLELDASTQADQAIGAATFLNEQAAEIQGQIQRVEDQITAIKAANGPLLAMQSQSTGNPVADAARIDSEIAGIAADNARIAAGIGAAGQSPEAGSLSAIQGALRAAQAKYSDSHPDVIALKAQLDTARSAATGAQASGNNANAQIISSNNSRIASLRAAKSMLLSQSSAALASQARAPVIVEKVSQLEKQAEALRVQYDNVGAKLVNAQVSARMQTEQKGERLTLADPPVIPEAPDRPNKPLILGGAVVAGLMAGAALVLLLELIFRPIRGTQALAYAGGRPPLVVIPQLDKKPGLILRLLQSRSRKKLARRRTARG